MFANAHPIAQSSLTAVIDAPVDQVWQLVRDFGRVADWHPTVSLSAIEGDACVSLGCIRRLTGTDGTIFREQLLTISDQERRLAYEMLEPPLPTAKMVNEVAVEAISDTGQTFIRFGSTYAARDTSSCAAIDRINTDVFHAALQGLRVTLRVGDNLRPSMGPMISTKETNNE